MEYYFEQLEGLDQYIEETLKLFNTPGCSIAIVKGDDIVYTKSFGYRDINKKLKVDEQTIFPIGSITKTFTALAIGILVDQGKMEWDKPVIDYLPEFRVKDAYISEHITTRDLLSHRSGIPGHNFVWNGADITREELISKVKHLDPNIDFRTLWQYNNIMFGIAGLIIERISGQSYEEFVRENILDPLGMTSVNFTIKEYLDTANYALPYTFTNEFHVNPFEVTGPALEPCGCLNSNIRDMANFIKLFIKKGEFNGKRIISENSIKEIGKPQIVNAEILPLKYNEYSHANYGLGVAVYDYGGYTAIGHGGHMSGFYSMAGFIPEKDIGFVILDNANDGMLLLIGAMYTILDKMLGLEPIDWNARIKTEVIDKYIKAAQIKKTALEETKRKNTVPSHSLEEYAGRYSNPAYPDIKIIQTGNSLELNITFQNEPLKHYHYDIFTTVLDLEGNKETYFVTFFTGRDGNIVRLEINLEPKDKDIVFIKM